MKVKVFKVKYHRPLSNEYIPETMGVKGIMKKWIFWVFGMALLLPLVGHAQEGWVIEGFESDIEIQADGWVGVRETIAVDFGELEKHGIYRDLPYVYRGEAGNDVYTRISDIAVIQDGKEAEVEVTRNSANLRIRVGDPDATISGKHTYVIFYRVTGVLQPFEGFDELNWNVTGNDWEAPITAATARVTVPAEIIQVACYEGSFGATDKCQRAEFSAQAATFESRNLVVGQGLTVAVGFEPGVVPVVSVEAPPTFTQALFSPAAGITGLVITGFGLGWLLSRWYRFGRDRYWQRAHLPGERSDREGKKLPEKILPLGYRQPVSVEYEPPDGLRPAEMGVLLDERADTLDASATIVDLAARGYLEIREIPKKWIFGNKDYEFTRTEKPAAGLLNYEETLLAKLFEDGRIVKMSDLKNSFYVHLKKVKDLLYTEMVRKKLFPKNPEKVRAKYMAMGGSMAAFAAVVLTLMGLLLREAWALAWYHPVLAGISLGLWVVGICVIFMNKVMPRKTGYGRELYERVKGYELFVSGTEKYRAPYYENHNLFVEVLPYAIMFGVTDKLAKAFKDMGITPPAPVWYHGGGGFHPVHFASSMNSFSSSLSGAMASKPSSSGSGGGGGGFSGGGFGGGGGGSW